MMAIGTPNHKGANNESFSGDSVSEVGEVVVVVVVAPPQPDLYSALPGDFELIRSSIISAAGEIC